MRPRIAFVIGAPVLLVVAAGLAALVPAMKRDAPPPVAPAVVETPRGHVKRERRRQDEEKRNALRAQISDPKVSCRYLLSGSMLVSRAPSEALLEDCRRLLDEPATSPPHAR